MAIDPSVAGALIGFVGGSATALGTQYLAGRLQAQRLTQEFANAKRLKDDSEIRGVLDDALSAALGAQDAIEAYWDAVVSALDALVTEDMDAAIENADGFEIVPIVRALVLARSRLAIRLGTNHPLTSAFVELQDAVLTLGRLDASRNLAQERNQIKQLILAFAERATEWAARPVQ